MENAIDARSGVLPQIALQRRQQLAAAAQLAGPGPSYEGYVAPGPGYVSLNYD